MLDSLKAKTAMLAILIGGCSVERPGRDISAEVREAFASKDEYEIRPRELGRFDCICVLTSYQDDAENSMKRLAGSKEVAECAVSRVPIDLDDDDGAFLLIDRNRQPTRLEVQSFDVGAMPALLNVTINHQGCQKAVRARVSRRSGHQSLETFPS